MEDVTVIRVTLLGVCMSREPRSHEGRSICHSSRADELSIGAGMGHKEAYLAVDSPENSINRSEEESVLGTR